jgi:hypothetical protein
MALYIKLFFSVFFILCFITGTAQDTKKDTVLRVKELPSVIVTADKNARRNNAYHFTVTEYKSIVSILGETDALRYIATLPGVSQGMEGGMGFFVRSGNSGNNRIELDGVPVYGNTHLFGLLSVFPSDIIENVDFRTGNIAASSGDFLASLTQITSITPDKEQYHGSFSVSPFVVGATCSGYLSSRITFQVAGRISPLKAEYEALKKIVDITGNMNIEMDDVYAKLNYRINSRHHLSLSGYLSNDYLQYAADIKENVNINRLTVNWGNKLVRAAWNWNMNDLLTMNVLSYCNYFVSGQRQEHLSGELRTGELRLQTALTDMTAKILLAYNKDNLYFDAGIQGKWQSIQPGAEKMIVKTSNYTNITPTFYSSSIAGFGDVKYRYRFITALLGFRGTLYNIEQQTIFDGNVRASVEMVFSKKTGMEFTYDGFSQFYHVAEGLPVGWSLDLIFPADKKFRPEKAHQLYTGGYWNNEEVSVSSGIYYKYMNNLISYKNGINVFGVQNTSWQDEVAVGRGNSYGWETRFEKKGIKWNATVSYTLSKTSRQFDEINEGRSFPSKFDRKHILNLTGQWHTIARKHWKHYLNISIAFSSGNKVTIPVAMYKGIPPPYWEQQEGGFYISPQQEENAFYRQLMSNVNGYTVPDYFRIDLSYNFVRTGKHFINDLTIGVFNLLNRQNPYLIFHEDGMWKQLSIFPIIPSIRWSLAF